MTSAEITVAYRRFLPGCAARLSEKTALLELSVRGDVMFDAAAETRIRQRAFSLCPGEDLFPIAESDWPSAFLVDDVRTWDEEHRPLRRLGIWAVALTVAIQRWGRDPVWRGSVLDAGDDWLRLAIPWQRESQFDRAAELALKLIAGVPHAEPAADGESSWPTLADYFGDEWPAIQDGGLRPNTLRFVEAAVRRGMPFDVLPGFVQIGWGANARRLDQSVTGRTSWIAMALARNKLKTSQTLSGEGIPTPACFLVGTLDQARWAADQIGWPVVVKPGDHDGGEGVVIGIADPTRLADAFDHARQFSPNVLVERFCPGDDHRLLVVRGRVLQVARRTPARIVGDGVHTVSRLVDRLNSDPRRGAGYSSLLKAVMLEGAVLDCLAEQGMGPESVPPDGKALWLSRVANVSAGGTAEDVTGLAHPDNLALAVRAARIVGLDVAGVDFVCPDISRSWREVGGVICDVNGQPGFRPHWLADPVRDINGEVLDLLVDSPARIPTAAITGTNGKTTTAEMLHRIWTEAGRLTGVCTTARVRIGEDTVSTDNLSGQPGARMILNDPGVQAAVLEMPRKGLIYFGHHCDRYDVAALLNVQDDHIGVDGIETIEQMAELKAEVLERATDAVVVNAEDPLCLAMLARAGTGRHVLVARTPDAPAVVAHRRQDGEAVFVDERDGRPWIILANGASATELMPLHDIPATLNGLLPFNETNALFAAALAWAQGLDRGTIRRALGAFGNSVEHNPGRFNVIEGLPFEVVVDFAHNPDGVRAVCSAAARRPVAGRRVLCSLNIGSRHPGHIQTLAPLLARLFDEFVIGCDPQEVGRCPEYAGADPAGGMVTRFRALLLDQGADPDRISCEVDRLAAVRAALDRARPGDLVVLLADQGEAQRAVEAWLAVDVRRPAEVRSR